MTAILSPAIKHYEWGDFAALPDLLGLPRDEKPWAELWYGTHRDGPATLQTANGETQLKNVVGDLSFLLKLIAVAKPLSLQTHPTILQALEGFARENKQGLGRTEPNRVYKDEAAKPELLCALSEFQMLCGFAPINESLARAEQNGWHELAQHLKIDGLENTVRWALDEKSHPTPQNLPNHLHALASLYPNSGGILVALLMNHVVLKPGDAIFLEPGNVHSYLSGLAVEVMTSSDNVMRAAFTTKHVDLNEFFATANLVSEMPRSATPPVSSGDFAIYDISSAPFSVQRLNLTSAISLTAEHEVEIFLCVQGQAGSLHQGQACVLRRDETLQLTGPSLVFRVWGDPTN
ncbi:MAG: mannose-6-phosphate isomerase, class I [Actinobacteria bacterium]|nr:mannose-6-phosphate isomerase, class I [Actinomycetota bacterium]